MDKKPLILEIEEAKNELVESINDIVQKHGLNFYLLEPTFDKLYAQVKAVSQNELAQARAQFETAKEESSE